MTNYYAILHVLPSAEIDVIKAAYKALARKYHPDTFNGDKAYAGKRMQEINDAFAVIGDPEKRKKYDAERKTTNQKDEYSENGEDIDAKSGEDWVVACKYCPKAMAQFKYLHKLSPALAFTFQSYLLDTKKFMECDVVRKQMEDGFLKTFFGDDQTIQRFAKGLILVGERKAAMQVNRAVKVLGDSLDVKVLKDRIYTEFPLAERRLRFRDVKNFQGNIAIGLALLKSLGLTYNRNVGFIRDDTFNIEYQGKTHHKVPLYELNKWIVDNLSDHKDLRGI